jgi:hypothetical protein
METNYIEMRKYRDFGEVFNATFAFLRQEFKPLITKMLVYFGPVAVLSAIAVASYLTSFSSIFKLIQGNPESWLPMMMKHYAMMILATWLSQSMLVSVVFTYMALYNERGKGNFSNEEYRDRVFANFAKALIFTIPIGLLLMLGIAACFIPGIYLGVVFAFFFPIVIFENKSFGEAFGRSFTLGNYAWWWSFLLIIVCYIIVSVVGMLFTLPATLFTSISMFHSIQGEEVSSNVKLISTIVTVVANFIGNMLYVVPLTAVAFQFFSIKESLENTRLMDKIDSIGNEGN